MGLLPNDEWKARKRADKQINQSCFDSDFEFVVGYICFAGLLRN